MLIGYFSLNNIPGNAKQQARPPRGSRGPEPLPPSPSHLPTGCQEALVVGITRGGGRRGEEVRYGWERGRAGGVLLVL